MKKEQKPAESETVDVDLRKRADDIVREKAACLPENIETMSFEDTQHLVHELEVHQIELAMQNEELRRAQAALEVARERYFDLYDLAPVGYITLSEQGLILEANLTAATLLGAARNALSRQPISLFILKEDQDIYYLHRKQLFETGEPQECDLRMVRKDGTTFYALLRATVAQDTEGAPVCRVVMNDITARKQVEEALREKEQQIKTFFDATTDMVFLKDANYHHIVVNPALCKFYGKAESEIIGKTDFDLMAEKAAAECRRTDERALCSNGLLISEEVVENRYYETRKFPIEFAEGKKGIGAYIRDITERKQKEEAIARAAQEWQTTFDAASDAIWLLDREQRVVRSNKRAELFFRRPYSELISRHCWEIVHGTTQPIPECPLQRARESLHREIIDLQIGSVWFNVTVDPILDATGRYVGAVHIVRDITQRKKTESQREAALEATRQFNEILEQRVNERTAELRGTIAELKELNRAFVGRELKMAQLKERIAELEKKA